jgi:hypothetical protein
MEDFHMNLNFAAGFALPTERTHRTPWSFPTLQILQNPHPRLAEREDQLPSRDALRKSQQGASRVKNSWNAASSSHGEQMRNGECSQAWAEFCITYCKRLSLLLAIPAIKIGCSDGALWFMVISGNGPDG